MDMLLNEQMGFARILYDKGLYQQALKILDKLKESAKEHHHYTFRLQALIFEKKIESLHITRSMEDRAEQLTNEVNEVTGHLVLLNKFSNLGLQLYSWYIKMGHARDIKDAEAVKLFFVSNLPEHDLRQMDFYEKLYMYQAFCWYGFILQDFLLYYRYTQKWLNLFIKEPNMQLIEISQFIKAYHNLLTAHFVLNNHEKFLSTLLAFEKLEQSEAGQININAATQIFLYLTIAKINKHFLEGTFTEGTKLVPDIETKIIEYKPYIDQHRILVIYYKIACLYFGSGDNEKAIDYLNKIINWKVDLRTDLQCYSRLLHLIAHFELENYNLIEYLVKSVYRFMSKMKNLSVVEEEVLSFLKKSFTLNERKILPAFKFLKEKLEKHKGNPYETRSYLYLDIVSWLESKINDQPVQQVIHQKFIKNKN